jgi:hypothetical protein
VKENADVIPPQKKTNSEIVKKKVRACTNIHSPRSGFSHPQALLQIAQILDVSSKEGAVIGMRKFHSGQHWHKWNLN